MKWWIKNENIQYIYNNKKKITKDRFGFKLNVWNFFQYIYNNKKK